MPDQNGAVNSNSENGNGEYENNNNINDQSTILHTARSDLKTALNGLHTDNEMITSSQVNSIIKKKKSQNNSNDDIPSQEASKKIEKKILVDRESNQDSQSQGDDEE